MQTKAEKLDLAIAILESGNPDIEYAVEVLKSVKKSVIATPSNEWRTPEYILKLVRDVLGVIDLDPSSSEAAQKNVKASRFYDKESNGLEQFWFGKVFCNPPYGNFSKPFLAKAFNSPLMEEIVFLLNRTGASWYLDYKDKFSAICEVTKRIAFLDENNVSQKSPRYYNDILYLGPNVELFRYTFSEIGKVYVNDDITVGKACHN